MTTLCMFSPRELSLERGWPGRVEGERVVQLAAQTLQAYFTGGGSARAHAEYALADCVLRAPVLAPPSLRVFPSSEEAWRLFSFRLPLPVRATGEPLVYPEGVGELVPRPALAAIVGAEGTIGGFTLANLWTARDLERAEREAGAAPGKSADFGISLGPLVASPDSYEPAPLRVRLNGEAQESGWQGASAERWEELRAHAAQHSTLSPGDLLALAAQPWGGRALEAGDVVEIEAPGLGVLRSEVAAPEV